MTDRPDSERDCGAASRLGDELRALHAPPFNPPVALDRSIEAASRAHFVRANRRMVIRRIAPLAAAAAIVFALIWLEPLSRPGSGVSTIAAVREDIDGNGRVDILDAFDLARRLETGEGIRNAWDVTGDGRVDDADVNAVAMAAVRLSKG